MTNPLCPILALLTLAPHPLSSADVAIVVDLPEPDCRRALLLMCIAGRVVHEDDGRFTVAATREVIYEAVSAVRAQHRVREIRAISERTVTRLAELNE